MLCGVKAVCKPAAPVSLEITPHGPSMPLVSQALPEMSERGDLHLGVGKELGFPLGGWDSHPVVLPMDSACREDNITALPGEP